MVMTTTVILGLIVPSGVASCCLGERVMGEQRKVWARGRRSDGVTYSNRAGGTGGQIGARQRRRKWQIASSAAYRQGLREIDTASRHVACEGEEVWPPLSLSCMLTRLALGRRRLVLPSRQVAENRQG